MSQISNDFISIPDLYVAYKKAKAEAFFDNMHPYSRDLARESWGEVRTEFYGLVHRHLLTPRGMFEFTTYYHRIFSLMLACHDWDAASKFVSGIKQCFLLISETTTDGTDEPHLRDKIRIKGGISDFFVIGDIDYQSLRKFQRRPRGKQNPEFKPLPIGFEMSEYRKKGI